MNYIILSNIYIFIKYSISSIDYFIKELIVMILKRLSSMESYC